MDLQKYLIVYKHPKNIDDKLKKQLEDEFTFFSFNYDLWYYQVLLAEENNPNKSFDHDDKMFNFFNQQEQNLTNLVKLKQCNLSGKVYFNFKEFWKECF